MSPRVAVCQGLAPGGQRGAARLPSFSRRAALQTLPGSTSRCRPRAAEHGALNVLVPEHLETFLAEARTRGDGDCPPNFVERELQEFLTFGRGRRGRVVASGVHPNFH